MWLLLFVTIPSFAYDFKSGDLYYNIKDGGTVEVTYQDEYNNYPKLTSAVIPESVTYEGTAYSVTSIGRGGFLRLHQFDFCFHSKWCRNYRRWGFQYLYRSNLCYYSK